ncbi:myosin-2 heavy chain, non muscle-like isoform X4 [Mytilus californianus]|uniref:myosin-2 heavy chain, non muscle-like isoform X4 n=1 Tax=Mytilus californianus TaxID=6549 RepID=UPI002245FE59|nr:myosin-2 heavy chain, non muscle-like isoform X4 [Mytilus californianus]
MALVSSSSQFDRFSVAANELQDHIVDIYGNKENELELFRPSLADHHKVGFFTLDRCSQTDVTEVVELKDMTEVLQLLLKDVHKMKRDINLTKSVMQADYEAKVQEKATELYCRINEKVAELERIHEDRVSTVRKAFRQQLADAVARLAVLYNKNLENKMQKEKQKQAGDQYLLDEKYRELQQTIQQNQNVIQMLKLQLAQYQQSKVDLESTVEADPKVIESPSPSERPSNNTPASIQSPISQKSKSPLAPPPNLPPPPPPMETKKPKKSKPQPPPEPAIESVSMRTPSPQFNQELEDLRVEVEDLNVKVNNLQDQVDSKDDENKKLDQQIETLNQELDQEKIKSDKINKDLENTKKAAENEKASSEKLTFKDIRQFTKMDKQRAEMERMFQQKLQKAQEEAEANAQRESIAQQSAEKDKVKLLQDQKKLLEEQLAKERKKNQEKAEMDTDIDKYIKNEKRLKEEIERLKREIERVHRTWEKKFAILQQSLHALKDESYIRQTLQRQAAALHHAAVSYAVDTPMGILPTNKINSPIKKPVIPDIGRGRQQPQPQPAQGQPLNVGGVLGEKDYISYTVSAPSGRGTAMFSVDENQVMSEGEDDLPVDVQPLPDPPSRPSQEFVTDGTPSEKEKARLYHEGQKT